jgi:hypothetical protein
LTGYQQGIHYSAVGGLQQSPSTYQTVIH